MTALARTWERPLGAHAAPAHPVARVRAPSLAWLPFAVALVGYLGLGLYLVLALHAINGDAYSRMTNAYSVLFSRDPHLAAIGFVWPPLPTFIELSLVPLKIVWPAIVQDGVVPVIMSAVFMAGAVHQVNRTLADFAVGWVVRVLLVGAFALHPMIVYYGAIGTSEAPTLFFLLVTVRYLARWVREPAVTPLVLVGAGLAGAYLTRYEALFSAIGVAALVGLLTLTRSRGRARGRMDAAVADVAIVLAPFTLAFVGWALASWLIVGSPFEQFTSAYGNSSQIAVWKAEGADELGAPPAVKLGQELLRLGAIEIALAPAIGLAAMVGWRRRDDRWLAVLAVLAPALAFMVFGYVTNALFPWLRFLILAVPMAVLLLGLAAGGIAADGRRVISASVARRRLGTLARAATIGALACSALASVPAAAAGMLDPAIGVEESRDIGGLLKPGGRIPEFATEREIAEDLDRLQLPEGSVLVDTFLGFAIVAESADPRQFVITSDQDFRAVLASPQVFGVRYLLAPRRIGLGALDAVNTAYPALAGDGAGFARLERTFAGREGSSDWGLFRVVAP